ncbi:hypothetical protein NXS19_011786 [Fusarium pseudograminearum]|nr:hypothetical protein NXS19_011786 [Fusarium pseudograminearum]
MSQTAITVASPHAKESRIRSNTPMSQNGSTAAAKPPRSPTKKTRPALSARQSTFPPCSIGAQVNRGLGFR